MVEQRTGPGRWLYLLALGIFVAGLAVTGVLVVISVTHFQRLSHSFIRVVAPGTSTVQLEKRGTYTVFYEYQSQVDGQTFSTGETPPNLTVGVKSVATGNAVAIHSSGNSNYSIGSHAGVSILNFSIDSPGAYEISSQYSNGTGGPEIVLAIAHGFASDIVGGVASILGSVGVFCGTTLVAIVLTLVVFILRQRKRGPVAGPMPPAPSAGA